MKKMAGAGSQREFYRVSVGAGLKPALTKAPTAILMKWDGKDPDWDYFLALNEIAELRDIIPTIIEADRAESKVLVRDCGEFTLKDLFVKYDGDVEKQKILLDKVSEKLLAWQSVNVPKSNIISKRIFSMPDLLWETNYFREHISPIFPETKQIFESQEFENERQKLAKLVDNLPKCLMHRDFQSENIIFDRRGRPACLPDDPPNVAMGEHIGSPLRDDTPSFVDVQGARMGAEYYDVASLVFDPYLYPKMTEELRKYFLGKMGISDKRSLYLCALQRLSQAMGAYGNLSTNKGKPHYKDFIKPAAIQAKWICEELGEFPNFQEIFNFLSMS